MVYNLCLLGALRDKPNNFGLTQRLNQKTLVTFMTVILPCSLAWSFTALSTAFICFTELHTWGSPFLPTVAV